MIEFISPAELIAADGGNVHVECGRNPSAALLEAFRAHYRTQRRVCVVETDAATTATP